MATEMVSPGVPPLAPPFPLPGGGRHQPPHLVRQVHAGELAQTQGRPPLVDLVDLHLLAEGVEVGVARLLERLAHVDRAVRRVATEEPSVHDPPAIAGDAEVGRHHPFLQRRDRHRHLEGRPRRVPPLQRAVVQRTKPVAVEPPPGLAVDAAGEYVRVVGGSADEGEDLARTGIQEHRRTVEPGVAERVLRRLLQIVVEGELNLPTLAGQPFVEHPDLPPDVVDDDPPRAVEAHQQSVVDALDAGLADDRAAAQVPELGRGQLGLADLADVPQDVSARLFGRIEPDGKLLHVDSGQFPGMRGNGRHLLERGVPDEDHRPERRIPAVAFEGGPELGQRHAGEIGDEGHGALQVLGLLAGQRDVERVAVLGEHAAVTVEDRTARGGQDQGSLVIVLRVPAVLVVLDDLQPPEPRRKACEHDDDAPPPHRQQDGEAVARPLPCTPRETAGYAHRLSPCRAQSSPIRTTPGLPVPRCSDATAAGAPANPRAGRPATARAGAAVRPRPESSATPPPQPARRRCWRPPASADRAG